MGNSVNNGRLSEQPLKLLEQPLAFFEVPAFHLIRMGRGVPGNLLPRSVHTHFLGPEMTLGHLVSK